MIALAAIASLALLAGWLLGLTLHALHVLRWDDPAARAVWSAGAGVGSSLLLLVSLIVCLGTRSLPWLMVPLACVPVGGLAAVRASEALRLRAPTERGGEHEP